MTREVEKAVDELGALAEPFAGSGYPEVAPTCTRMVNLAPAVAMLATVRMKPNSVIDKRNVVAPPPGSSMSSDLAGFGFCLGGVLL